MYYICFMIIGGLMFGGWGIFFGWIIGAFATQVAK